MYDSTCKTFWKRQKLQGVKSNEVLLVPRVKEYIDHNRAQWNFAG